MLEQTVEETVLDTFINTSVSPFSIDNKFMHAAASRMRHAKPTYMYGHSSGQLAQGIYHKMDRGLKNNRRILELNQ